MGWGLQPFEGNFVKQVLPIESSMEGNYHSFPLYLDFVVITYTCLMGVLASFGYVKYGDSVQQIIGRLVGRVACVLSLHHWNFHDQLLRKSKYCADMHATCDM